MFFALAPKEPDCASVIDVELIEHQLAGAQTHSISFHLCFLIKKSMKINKEENPNQSAFLERLF